MEIKKLIRYYIFRDSLKEIEMNRILDKISKKLKLTKREVKFLDLYNTTVSDPKKDYMMLSKSVAATKVKDLLESNIKVICNLHDRDGKIGLPIIDIVDDIEEEFSTIIMKNENHKLEDKFLYNLIYNNKKSQYSLEEHDEYYEKIEAKND